MRCLQCGNDNLEPARLCQVCGAALPINPLDSRHAVAGGSAEQPLVSLLYRALLGPVHTDYYLQQFARFDAAGKAGMSWHWPACFATLGWLAFRRMWREALLFAALSVALALLVFSVATLLWGASPEELWALLALYLLMLAVLPALWANALYYHHCNRLVTQALSATPDIRQAFERLADHASTVRRAWVAATLWFGVWLSALAFSVWLATASPGHATLAAAVSTAARGAASAPAAAVSAPGAASTALPAPAAPASAPPAAASAASPLPALTASSPARSSELMAPAQPKAPASAVPGSSKQGKFIVAVGQFAQEQNASRAYDKLEAAGLPVYSNTVQTQAGTLLLIRVGPFRTLEDARQAAQQIKALGLPAVVMKR